MHQVLLASVVEPIGSVARAHPGRGAVTCQRHTLWKTYTLVGMCLLMGLWGRTGRGLFSRCIRARICGVCEQLYVYVRTYLCMVCMFVYVCLIVIGPENKNRGHTYVYIHAQPIAGPVRDLWLRCRVGSKSLFHPTLFARAKVLSFSRVLNLV